MGEQPLSDEELLASHELGSFALFYRAHVDELLGFFCRRTRDPELAADLTAEFSGRAGLPHPRSDGAHGDETSTMIGGSRLRRPWS
jgi:hypothetical protein